MAPILNAKLALFEAKKVARGLIEKDLTMWACRRPTYYLLLTRCYSSLSNSRGSDNI